MAAPGTKANLTLRASAGAGIKAPSFFESYGTSLFALGNPDLKPATRATYDVGFDLRLGESVKVQATYFRHQYLDQIEYRIVSFSPFCRHLREPGRQSGGWFRVLLVSGARR